MKIKNEYSYFIFALVISFVISTFECIPMFLIYYKGWPSPVTIDFFSLVPIASLFLWYVLTFISILTSFFIVYKIIKPYSSPVLKRKSGVLKAMLVSTAVLLGFNLLLYKFTNLEKHTIPYLSFSGGLIISSVTTIYAYFIRLNNINQNIRLENEILKKENLQSQYEVLKSNLSPHFLFNSLSALQPLIREKPDVANEYVIHLSSLLRYALQKNEDKFIRLSEEMMLTRSFIFLLEMRYGQNLIIESQPPEREKNWRILPFTVQQLIENAVKHNEISEKNPLRIKIEIDPSGWLIISNNIREKITRESSLGSGLANLSRRYKLITGKEVQVSNADRQFRVTIPLTYFDDEGSDN